MVSNNVQTKIEMTDKVSKNLKNIEKNMKKLLSTTKQLSGALKTAKQSLDTFGTSANKTSHKVQKLTNAMERNLKATERHRNETIRSGVLHSQVTTKVQANTTARNENTNAIRNNIYAVKNQNTALRLNSTATNNATTSQNRYTNSLNQSENGINSYVKGLGALAVAYAGLETLKSGINISDQVTLSTAKLSQLTDDVEGFKDRIYEMSQDARSDYLTNMSQIAKMGINTGGIGEDGVFGSEEELIQFNELLSKTFVLGGTGFREMNASVYQLTQALSSGRLQGDEFRSLIENAPMYANAIVDYLNKAYNEGKSVDEQVKLTLGDVRELGAEGVITSDIMKNALFAMQDEVREKFEEIPLTFEQVLAKLKNQFIKVAQPVLKLLNDIANSEAFEKTTQSIVKLFAIAMACITPVIQGIMTIGQVVADNWQYIEPVIWGIVGALVAYYTILGLVKLVTFLHAKAVAIWNGVMIGAKVVALGLATIIGWLTGTEMVNTQAALANMAANYGLSASMMTVLAVASAVILIFVAVIAIIYAVVWAYNKLTGATLSATGIIIGAFATMGALIINVFIKVWNEIVTFVEYLINVFDNPVYSVKKAFGEMAIGILKAFRSVGNGLNGLSKDIVKGIEWMINGAIGLLNGMIDKYNRSTFGEKFGTIDRLGEVNWSDNGLSLTDNIDKSISDIEAWVGPAPDNYKSLDYLKKDFIDLTDTWNKGYNWGAEKEQSLKDFFKGFEGITGGGTDGFMKDYQESLDKYNPEAIDVDTTPNKDVLDAIDKANGKLDNIDENTKISEEDLKYLTDLAERRAINRFTASEIQITNYMNNTISNDIDLDGFLDSVGEVMIKSVNAGSEATHY